MRYLSTAIILIAIIASIGCKSDWDESLANAPMAGLPKKLPKVYENRFGTKIYSDRPVTEEEQGLIAAGIADQLGHSRQYAQTLGWNKYKNPDEYKVLLIDSDIQSVTPEILGCRLIDTYAGRAAGTVAGAWGNKVVDPIIIVPRQVDYAKCGELFKNAVKHESEHVRLTNNLSFFQQFTGPLDVHPIFELWTFTESEARRR